MGKMAGEVFYALRAEELAEHIPPNLEGFQDVKGMHMDRSRNIPEIESNREKVYNVRFLLTARDSFDELKSQHDSMIQQQMLDHQQLVELRKRLDQIEEDQRAIIHQLKKIESPALTDSLGSHVGCDLEVEAMTSAG